MLYVWDLPPVDVGVLGRSLVLEEERKKKI